MAEKIPPMQTEISASESAAIGATTAVYSNKMYANLTPSGLRLTFAETYHDPLNPSVRFAVVLPYVVAAQLVDLIQFQLGQLAETVAKAEKS